MSLVSGQSTTDHVLESVVADAEAAYGKDAFVTAKEEFYSRFGKVFPEDPFYESRMSYFLDFFVLLRPIPGESSTPFMKFASLNKSNPAHLIVALESFRHSIFEVESVVGSSGMSVLDLRTGEIYKVKSKGDESFRGFTKGAVFQGFLFPSDDFAFLGNGLVMHPSQALVIIKKFLKNAVKSVDFDEQGILARLAFVQLKALRHSHAGAKRIYGNELAIS